MSTDSSIDQQFVQYIVQSLVSQPDAVQIKRTIDEKGVLLELTVAPDDLGRVIGKRGNTAQSIRTLLRALGTKNDARYNLKIVDVGPPRDQQAPAATATSDDGSSQPADTTAVTDDGQTANAVEPVAPAADPWAHLRSDDTTSTSSDVDGGEAEQADDSSTDSGNEESSVVEKTRKELEDLADLDI